MVDATLHYMASSMTAPRVSVMVPHAKFVVILRVWPRRFSGCRSAVCWLLSPTNQFFLSADKPAIIGVHAQNVQQWCGRRSRCFCRLVGSH